MFIDLTHPLDETLPTWDGSCGFCKQLSAHGNIRTHQYNLISGAGTHIDAPAHFYEEGSPIDELPLEKLMVPLYVLHQDCGEEEKITAAMLLAFEKKVGKIAKNSVVAVSTGWSKRWHTPLLYRNSDKSGIMRFPTFDESCCAFLLERDVAGIGIDTLSPDSPTSPFPLHFSLLGAGKYILENLNNLDQVPPQGATLIALPMKIKGGFEAPVRALALLPGNTTFPRAS